MKNRDCLYNTVNLFFKGSDDAETTLLKAVLLHVICLYQQVVPHLVAQSNFDFSKLIKGECTLKLLSLSQSLPRFP